MNFCTLLNLEKCSPVNTRSDLLWVFFTLQDT